MTKTVTTSCNCGHEQVVDPDLVASLVQDDLDSSGAFAELTHQLRCQRCGGRPLVRLFVGAHDLPDQLAALTPKKRA